MIHPALPLSPYSQATPLTLGLSCRRTDCPPAPDMECNIGLQTHSLRRPHLRSLCIRRPRVRGLGHGYPTPVRLGLDLALRRGSLGVGLTLSDSTPPRGRVLGRLYPNAYVLRLLAFPQLDRRLKSHKVSNRMDYSPSLRPRRPSLKVPSLLYPDQGPTETSSR